jgi:hypothetical protein
VVNPHDYARGSPTSQRDKMDGKLVVPDYSAPASDAGLGPPPHLVGGLEDAQPKLQVDIGSVRKAGAVVLVLVLIVGLAVALSGGDDEKHHHHRSSPPLPWCRDDPNWNYHGHNCAYGPAHGHGGAENCAQVMNAAGVTAADACGVSCPNLLSAGRCVQPPAPTGCAGTWSEFTECTQPCGPDGTQQHTFTLSTTAHDAGCTGDGLVETSACNTETRCPIDCEGSFSPYSRCSVPCGRGGTESRSYAVTTQAQYGGRCPDLGRTEVQDCSNPQPCPPPPPPSPGAPPVDCAGNWENVGECSQPCGPGGTQQQAFFVSTMARYGGTCLEQGQTRTHDCNTEIPCPANCDGAWQDWSTCSVECGGGVQSRSFSVTTPAQNGGSCPDQGQTHIQDCNTVPCAPPPPPRGSPSGPFRMTITPFDDDTCTAREQECGPDDMNEDYDGNCPPGGMTDKPVRTTEFVSGECATRPSQAHLSFPWFDCDEGADVGSIDCIMGPNNAVKTTVLTGGEVRLQWYADADCSDEITGASVDDAFSQVFGDMMDAQFRYAGMPGIADCIEISTGFANYNQGMANDGCDVEIGMMFDQVRNRCTPHLHTARAVGVLYRVVFPSLPVYLLLVRYAAAAAAAAVYLWFWCCC